MIGCAARYSGSDVIAKWYSSCVVVGLGDDLAEPGLRQVVVGAVHEQQAAAVEQRASPSSSS